MATFSKATIARELSSSLPPGIAKSGAGEVSSPWFSCAPCEDRILPVPSRLS